jgi:protein-S-isoprenylcysteine O-methyltransferase Ste14
VAALGSAVFFLVAPGVVAGLMPWLLTGWDAGDTWLPLQVAGAVVLVAGVAALVYSFARFVTEGRGTPAPVAPTERLVVGGLYRYVRNPMYVAVLATIVGQALLLGRWVLLGYGAVVFLAVFSFVRLYEEPELERTYGKQYADYRRAVPGWLPGPRRFRR